MPTFGAQVRAHYSVLSLKNTPEPAGPFFGTQASCPSGAFGVPSAPSAASASASAASASAASASAASASAASAFVVREQRPQEHGTPLDFASICR